MQSWKKVSEERYWEMLEILPPAVMTHYGFLVGEPADHRVCSVTGEERPRFAPFLEIRGTFYEGAEPMTVPEFRAIKIEEVKG